MFINSCHAEFFFKHKSVFAFSIISQNLEGAGGWNLSYWKTSTYLSYMSILGSSCQGLSNHGIDLYPLEYSGFNSITCLKLSEKEEKW